MTTLKYFDRIQELRDAAMAEPPGPLPPFDFGSLGTRSALACALTRLVLRRLLPAIAFVLRQVWPNPRFGRVVLVTRAADAAQVLSDHDNFRGVYGVEMRELGGGADNVLSVDGLEHADILAVLKRCLEPEDPDRVSRWVAADAAALLEAGAGRIDALRDFVTRTATEATCRLFGITAHDPDEFGEWTMAISTQLFGDFTGDANVHRQARTASAHLLGVIDDAIARVRLNNEQHPNSRRPLETLIDRLVTRERMEPAKVRATIIGLATAFVPTNTLAAGNIFEVLLDSPRLWKRTVEAAVARDNARMREVLLEAGRLNPALSPGLWRHVPAGVAPPAIGSGWRARRTRPGDLVLVCIPSALRDGRSGATPAQRAWMMFGHGPHVCWGAELALAHLTAAFIELFRWKDLRPASDDAGRIQRTGAFPTRLDLTYTSHQSRRAMIIAALPVRKDVARADVEKALDGLGNPALPDVAATLTEGDRVQFASLSVIEREPESAESILLLEISGDGDEDYLLGMVAAQCRGWLAPIVSLCTPTPIGDGDAAALAATLRAAHVRLDQRPFGHTGLHFDGMPELSVADIRRQERVAAFARHVIHRRLKDDLGLNTRAMGLLLRTRRLIKGDSFLALRRKNASLQRLVERLGIQGALLRPGRRRLAIADWRKPESLWPGIAAMVGAPENRALLALPIALLVAWTAVLLLWWSPLLAGVMGWALAVAVAAIAAVPLTLVTLALPFVGLVAWLRQSERRDPVDERAADLAHARAIVSREDAPGHVQNHIVAVMPFKPGLLRRLTFAFTMWGILQTVRHFFRPGFVLTMGTIHKARWFRVPGTRQFVFFSNYDGSWESYLEDFITRAHEGQTAAWSHGVGFPRTRFLILDGAADGDRFKRWVRRQQRETRFWYSRFPHLTAQQIRNNAMIEDGLAHATSDTDARRWLASFGSAQREAHELEADEVQSLAFSGLPRLTEATALMLRLPEGRKETGRWLEAVSGLSPQPVLGIIGPPDRWLHTDQHGNRTIRLPQSARVLFGDRSWESGGAILGLTSAGLERCGLTPGGGLDSLPAAFRMTMAERATLLGDAAGAASGWRFCDDPEQAKGAHAILVLYGHEPGLTHAELVSGHSDLLNHFTGSLVTIVPCGMGRDPEGNPSLDYEPFGFRDGVSQPVIAGSRRAGARTAPNDLVAAGEILLGYRNHQGHLPVTVAVGPERDPACELPTVAASEANRYPWFGNRTGSYEPRDFGRNGSFLAVRQLDQDVERFWEQARRTSERLRHDYPGLADLAGPMLDEQWVAARIIGRWRNGTPLVGNPDRSGSRHDPARDNLFEYGVDDPRGLACPLGAHVRRTNPRASQEPGDPDELRITNRHRLLRRGRPYFYQPEGETKGRQGLLFMALCADLERQFEFVQRTWINSTTFHGLVDEHDPLLGPGEGITRGAPHGYFTIPTVAGPVRVTGLRSCVKVRGGGYFFLPSRSALAHLVTRSLH